MHGKAFDDRLGVGAMLMTVKALENAKTDMDIIGVILFAGRSRREGE